MTTETLNLPQVSTTPATVDFDFNTYKSELAAYISKYDIVVTEDTLDAGKKAATELNKLGDAIKKGFKKHVDELKRPADELSGYAKELYQMCQDGRAKIKEQNDKFEDVKREKCRELMTEHLAMIRDDLGVRDEYRTGSIDGLVKITATNKENNALTKQAKTDVENIAKEEQSTQRLIDSRLNGLKAISFDSGLDAPLERRHVESFLFAADDVYDANVKSIVDAELERQRVADERRKKQQEEREQRIKEDVEREARQKMEAEQRAQQQAAIESEPKQEPIVSDEVKQRAMQAVEPKAAPAGKRTVTVLVRYDVVVGDSVSDSDVINSVRNQLERLGKKPADVFVAE